MDRVCSWNVRGLNWPNKQEDLKIFLQEKRIGLIGMLETKVKERNVNKVATRLLQGWHWQHNFQLNAKGRIWVAWRLGFYKVNVLEKDEQFLHCKVTHTITMITSYITFVYGANCEGQRRALWEALKRIGQGMDEAWCILGDFNSVLHQGDRMGGTDIQDSEIKSFADCISTCELQEMHCKGPYFSWTNKIIWTRIDRVFVNVYWYDLYGFSQVTYMANVLSDHTALVIDTPGGPKPRSSFHFCDMWTRDPNFYPLVKKCLEDLTCLNPYQKLKLFLKDTQRVLQRLNRTTFADLKQQQCMARVVLEQHQISLLADPTNT